MALSNTIVNQFESHIEFVQYTIWIKDCASMEYMNPWEFGRNLTWDLTLYEIPFSSIRLLLSLTGVSLIISYYLTSDRNFGSKSVKFWGALKSMHAGCDKNQNKLRAVSVEPVTSSFHVHTSPTKWHNFFNLRTTYILLKYIIICYLHYNLTI